MASSSSATKLQPGDERTRIPPGQTLTAPNRWPVLTFGPTPAFDSRRWDLKLFGLVERELTLSYEQVRALPTVDVVADIHCVTGWSRLGDTWTGVPFREVLKLIGPRPEATHVMAHCEYGYTTSVPLEVLDSDDVLLCHSWNEAELAPEHGYPLRLLVPKKYLWKSAKWLRGLQFMASGRLGFWEQRGYHDEADPWREQRYW
ncbi:MAG: sulfite oxidase-like oxidoreductase [Candidatus Dormibacteraeota bacterium]|nr:sulfite oxidase-like oxidoreductase [Candidatus Dormibacteraeota bacterium]